MSDNSSTTSTGDAPVDEMVPTDPATPATSSAQLPVEQRKRLIVVLFLVALIALVAWVLSGNKGGTKADNSAAGAGKAASITLTAIPAKIVSKAELVAATKDYGFPIYWKGEMVNTDIELTVLTDGKVFVRYLPKGVAAGAPTTYFTVATYYDPAGFGKVQNLGAKAGAKYVKYSGGAIAASASESDSNVYLAFEGNPALYNIYSPEPANAWKAIDSGTISLLR